MKTRMEQEVGEEYEDRDLVAQVVEMDLEEVHMGEDQMLGFPQTVHPRPDVGNLGMKLDPPEIFDGRDTPFVTPWLTAVHRWAWLTCIPQDYLYDAIATKRKGGAATWMNNPLQVAARNQR